MQGGLKIAVACGGTGGHIFPGLATARLLKARGHEVRLWLAGSGVEASSVEGWDGAFVCIKASGFPSGVSIRGLRSAVRLVPAVVEALIQMRRERPSVLLCMGSYASVAPCLAARLLRIPVVLHEANAVPGRAISFLSAFASRVALGFEEAGTFFKVGQTVFTGFPLREGFNALERKRSVDEGVTLLVVGGSQGARVLNNRMPAAAALLKERIPMPLQVIHLAGMAYAEAVRARYDEQGLQVEVHAFCKDMPRLMSRVDLAVARAGAATCTELAVCGVPALLVPLPHAPRDHQARNAQAMAASGGMQILPESEFTVEIMAERLAAVINALGKSAAMRESLLKAVPADGTRRLADLVESVGLKL